MKKLTFTIGILLVAASTILAQAPQSFKYQAIARDAEGTILSNQNINIRISILSDNITGVAVYVETHNVHTSPFGLINLEIGNGKVESGDFSAIDWSKGKYYVNMDIDENGGTDYVSMGSSQLLSVPYALYAEESGSCSSSKEAMSWTEGSGVTYLTNPNNVGIGTTVPAAKLHVTGVGINAAYERNISTAAGPANRFYKSRGSESSKTQIQAGDNMGQFQFWGMGDDGAYNIGATIKAVAEGTRTGTNIFDVAASIQFLTANSAFNWGERMRITANGAVGIGTSAPAGILDIAGNYHFPVFDGTNEQVLKTDGSGNLAWSDDTGASQINELTDGKTGGNSVFLGSGAGANDDGSANENVGLGVDALNNNTNGQQNVAVGFGAMTANTSGYNNTAVGHNALNANTTGEFNTATGNMALYKNTSGIRNSAYGYLALYSNTEGDENTASGDAALYYNTIGNYNTALGFSANLYNEEGSNNTVIGYEAGKGSSAHNKSGNVFLGYQAGYNETGDNKLYIENSNSPAPLIYGEFDNDLVRINGDLDVTGNWTGMAIDDLSDGITIGNSVLLGSGAGVNDDGTDNQNVAIGIDALKSSTSGQWNTATGYRALENTTAGNSNTANGNEALRYNTTGEQNTAVGLHAMYWNTAGSYNTSVGVGASDMNTTGNKNTTLGVHAGYENTIGNNNTIIGYDANHYNQEGSNNTIVGYEAGKGMLLHNKSGNVFLGYQAGSNETGDNKLYIENSSSATPLIYGEFDTDLLRINGTLNINGSYYFPRIDGSNGQVLKTDGSGVLSWSSDIGATEIDDLTDGRTGGNSVFLGSGAGASDDLSDNKNVATGISALNANTSGEYNTATGYQSMQLNTTGSYNSAYGSSTLASNTTGLNNTAIGYNALNRNTTGNSNIALGSGALNRNTGGDNNLALGQNSNYYNTTGSSNTTVGNQSMHENVLGYQNTVLGYASSYSNTTGNQNVSIGYEANRYNETGSNNTIIGFEAGQGTAAHNKSGNVFLGFQAGFNEGGSNKLYIENSNSSSPLIYGEFDNDKVEINGSLEVTTTGGALVVPRMTTTERDALTPVNGSIIYNTTTNQFNFYENGSWVTK